MFAWENCMGMQRTRMKSGPRSKAVVFEGTRATLPACTVGGAASRVFNAQGQCEPSGLTCLMGVPAQAGHVEICNRIVARASTPEVGRTLAVAALLAAAHTCE
jgi:hypothetical protein